MSGERVVLVSQWYPPEPVEIPRSIAEALTSQGHHVEILTGIPNYPDGRVEEGYAAWRLSTERRDGLRIRRTPLFPSHDRSALRRMANYLSWAVSSALLGLPALRRAEVALVYSSPAAAALGPLLWHRVLRTPYVLIIQDLWPDSVTASDMLPDSGTIRILTRFLSAFVDATYRSAAHIVTISPGMKDLLAARGVPSEKVSLVYNWSAENFDPPSEEFRRDARRRLRLSDDDFVVSYAGNLGSMQGIDTLVRAAARLRGKFPLAVLIAGDGVEADRLSALALDEGAGNVRFLGRIGRQDMEGLRAAADVQFAGLIDDPLFSVTMPSKIQAILASGAPVIVCAPGDAAWIAEESGAGWAAAPGDVDGVAAAITSAWRESAEDLSARGRAARDYYARHMSREIGSARLSEILMTAADAARKVRLR